MRIRHSSGSTVLHDMRVIKPGCGQVGEVRRALSMRVSGFDPPKPVQSFMHLGFDGNMLVAIKKAGYARSLRCSG